MRRLAFCVVLVTLASSAGSAQEPTGGGPGPVLGIVEIPRLFRLNPETGQFDPEGALTLYTRPDSRGKVATTIFELPAIDDAEYGYEEKGALVYRRERGYYLIRTARGAGWLSPDDAGRFHALERLVTDGLAYATDVWDRFVSATPGGADRTRVPRLKDYGDDSVKVIASRTVAGRLWLHIEVLSHSFCGSDAPVTVRARGWLRAHDAAGAPTIWFSSRGC